MKYIAHRGYRTKNIKENTMEAFSNAQNNGFDGIELDVKETKDGSLVIIHDAFIDRVSNGEGFIKNFTYQELLNFNFGSNSVPSKIPLLKDVLIKYKDMIKIIELKGKIDIESITDFIDDKTYFISFDASHMNELKKKYPNIKVGVLNYILNSEHHYNLDVICLLDIIANDDIVMKFLNRGIKVLIYGIGKKIDYKKDYENLFYIVDTKFF